MVSVQESKTITWSFIGASILFVILTFIVIYFQKNKLKLVKKDFSNKFLILNFSFVVLFSIVLYVYAEKLIQSDEEETQKQGERLKNSIGHGYLAMIIAYFARLDMVIAPFWMIFITAYFLNMG